MNVTLVVFISRQHDDLHEYMPHVPSLSIMVNLEYGYGTSMDIFVARTRNYIRSLIEGDDLEQDGIRDCVRNFLREQYPENVTQNVDAYSIKAMVMAGDAIIRNRWNVYGANFMDKYLAHDVDSMKSVVRFFTEDEVSDLNESIRAMRRFEWDLDEDTSISWYELSRFSI